MNKRLRISMIRKKEFVCWSLLIFIFILNIAFTSQINKFPTNTAFKMGSVLKTSATDPIAYYNLNSNNTNVAVDQSINNNNGTISGAILVDGKNDSALEFDGDEDFITVSDNTALDFITGDFTIALWINIYSLPSRTPLLCQTDGGGGQPKWYVYLQNTSSTQTKIMVHYWSSDLSAYYHETDTMAMEFRTWIHLTFTKDGTNFTFWKDGDSLNSDTCDEFFSNPTANLDIGDDQQNDHIDNSFHGKMDEIRLYDRVLSAQEISNLYQGISGDGPEELDDDDDDDSDDDSNDNNGENNLADLNFFFRVGVISSAILFGLFLIVRIRKSHKTKLGKTRDEKDLNKSPIKIHDKNTKEMKQVYCTNCGAKNSIINRFCNKCGIPIKPLREKVDDKEKLKETTQIKEFESKFEGPIEDSEAIPQEMLKIEEQIPPIDTKEGEVGSMTTPAIIEEHSSIGEIETQASPEEIEKHKKISRSNKEIMDKKEEIESKLEPPIEDSEAKPQEMLKIEEQIPLIDTKEGEVDTIETIEKQRTPITLKDETSEYENADDKQESLEIEVSWPDLKSELNINTPATFDEVVAGIKKLKQSLDKGFISPEEFKRKKKVCLNHI